MIKVEKGFKKIACEILGITQRSYSNYAEQSRPIIELLEKYFTKKDLEEWLNNKKITKFENIQNLEKIDAMVKLKAKLFFNDFDFKTTEVILDYFYEFTNFNQKVSTKDNLINFILGRYFYRSIDNECKRRIFGDENEESKKVDKITTSKIEDFISIELDEEDGDYCHTFTNIVQRELIKKINNEDELVLLYIINAQNKEKILKALQEQL